MTRMSAGALALSAAVGELIVSLMENAPAPERHSWVPTASLISGVAVALIAFASAEMDSLETVIGGVLISCWAGLPLFVLGLAKDLKLFPRTHVALFGLSVLSVALSIISIHSRGSTSAIALLFIPLYLLFVYGLVGFVLLCRNDSQ